MEGRRVKNVIERTDREPLAGTDIERFADILKALASPARLRIVNILAGGEHTVTEICSCRSNSRFCGSATS